MKGIYSIRMFSVLRIKWRGKSGVGDWDLNSMSTEGWKGGRKERRKEGEVSERVVRSIFCPERGIHSTDLFTQSFRVSGNQASPAWEGQRQFLLENNPLHGLLTRTTLKTNPTSQGLETNHAPERPRWWLCSLGRRSSPHPPPPAPPTLMSLQTHHPPQHTHPILPS